MIENAITIDPNCVDAWAYLFTQIREADSESAALKAVSELADAEPNKKSAAPFVAVQGFFAANEETRDHAIEWAQKAVDRNARDPLALISLSALYGQRGDLRKVVEVLQPAEPLMARDVRLANNYFEALLQLRELDKVRNLLNALAGSQNPQVKQFAVERSRAVAQMLQQQARQMAGVGNRPPPKA